jgi:hypothetical protein
MEAGTSIALVMATWGRDRLDKAEHPGDCAGSCDGVCDRTAGTATSVQMPASASQAKGLIAGSPVFLLADATFWP